MLSGALRWIGHMQIGSAVAEMAGFLGHADAAVKVATIEALVSIRAAATAQSLIPLLKDGDREVRTAAARALGALSYAPARGPLEAIVLAKDMKEADRGEKVAFFEAFGRLAGAEGVPVLDRLLNSKSWLGKGEPSELRACAALGLARIRHPSARDALNKAAGDSDPVVRAAVARSLRGESQ